MNRTGAPYACERCGVPVRRVETESGRMIRIDADPHPDGNMIPWPNSYHTGLAVARLVDVPVTDGPMWRPHLCLYT